MHLEIIPWWFWASGMVAILIFSFGKILQKYEKKIIYIYHVRSGDSLWKA
jgi:hypothetical protein